MAKSGNGKPDRRRCGRGSSYELAAGEVVMKQPTSLFVQERIPRWPYVGPIDKELQRANSCYYGLIKSQDRLPDGRRLGQRRTKPRALHSAT